MRARNPSRRGYLENTAWVPHRLDMLASPAWRGRPRPLAKMLERLEVEHMRHGGQENGNLAVLYVQFVACGVSKKVICPMLEAGQALGLLEIIRPENWFGAIRPTNAYRLTYVPAKGKKAPTDEWSSVTQEQVDRIIGEMKLEIDRSEETARNRRKTA